MVAVGRIARVSKVDLFLPRVYIDLVGGLTGHFEPNDDDDWEVGDILFCEEGTPPERVDTDLWPESNEVGTVKASTPTYAVIEVDGKLRSYPQRFDPPFVKGQVLLMERNESPGPVISDKPIDRLGLHDREEFDIASLIVEAKENNTTLDDFGGSAELVKRATDLVTVALDPANRLSKMGVNPIKGILFSGPSGTGKTHLARALANASQADFYNIGGPAIVDMYVGQSERALRAIFDHAEKNKPAILFFDEIDSLYTARGNNNHEATNRLVGQFLALLDGFKRFDRVVVIATTNLPTALDSALLRPGRLGHNLVFTLPDHKSRVGILNASSRAVQFADAIDFCEIAEKTIDWTAADLAAIWTEAGILAALDRRESICNGDVQEAIHRVKRVTTSTSTGS
jgi:transitional endoplasmic reticulum ATPase